MSENTETVADVLRTITEDPTALEMLAVVGGEKPASSLGYESWVRPLKQSDGQILLEVGNGGPNHYIGCDSDGTLYVGFYFTVSGEWHKSKITRDVVERVIDRFGVTPVLRANAPFADGEERDT